MSDLYETIIQSPLISFKGNKGAMRGAVSFRGHKMFPSTARRLMELRPHIEAFCKKGISVREAAQKLGYSKQTVISHCRILGIRWPEKKFGGHRPRINKDGWFNAIISGAAEGKTQEEVGDSLGVHFINIHRYCKNHNIDWKTLRANGKAN